MQASERTKTERKIWGTAKKGYWVYVGKYGRERISPVFKTQAEARAWRSRGEHE